MRHLPVAVMWVDPGLMTGIALLEDGWKFWPYEYGFMEAGTIIESAAAAYGPTLAVGWEAFSIRPKTPAADAHHAIEMIGVTRRIATRACCQILPPAQPHTPKTAERRILQALGWWTAGKNDAQSAAWHMVAWLLREGIAPPHVMAAVLGEREEQG
jgi:hypothetical protein